MVRMWPATMAMTHRIATSVLVIAGLAGPALLIGCHTSFDPRAKIDELVDAGRFDEATELLEETLEATRGDPELLYLYGRANMGRLRPSLAIWPFMMAKDHPGWEEKAGLGMVEAAVASGDHYQAIQFASQLLEAKPDLVSAREMRAQSRIETKNYQAALEDADRLIVQDEKNIAAQVVRLQALIGLERMEEIENDFDKLEKIWKDESFPPVLAQHYCAARALFAHEKGDESEATRRFEACLESFPNSRLVLTEAVSFFDATGDPARGTKLLEEALEREPSATDLSESLATRLRERGEIEEATQILIAATKGSGPEPAKPWGALAYHYFAIDQFDESVAAWQEVLRLIPQPDEGILFSYAEALARAHRFDEAEGVAQKLPESLAALTRAIVFLERGEPETALEHFDAGQRLWPNNAVARYFAGIAAERAGDVDRAIGEFRQAIRIDADETPAALHLARIHQAEGFIEASRTALGHFQSGHPNDAEGNLLALRIAVQLRGPGVVERAFSAFHWPQSQLGSIVAEAAEIVEGAGGAKAAAHFLNSIVGIDLLQPSNALALQVLTRTLTASGQAAQARAKIDEALKAHPESAALHEILAVHFEQLGGDPDAVRAEREKALELDPSYAKSLAAKAESMAARGLEKEARSLFERAAASDSRDFGARRRAAELAGQAGEIEAAIKGLDAVLADSPQDIRVAISLARLLQQRGSNPERAAKMARLAVRFRGGSDAFEILNRTHLAAGMADQAVAALQNASERQHRDPSLYYYLGVALEAAGRSKAAVASFQQAIALGNDEGFPEREAAEAALAESSQSASNAHPEGIEDSR